jgi:hypothetical protein
MDEGRNGTLQWKVFHSQRVSISVIDQSLQENKLLACIGTRMTPNELI